MPAIGPSRLLRFCSGVVALLWWPCIVVALLFALAWGALHGLIVPRIGDLRPTLENRLSKSLGADVQIGQITAQFNLLAPSFEFTDVRLKDTAGREALLLKKVIATLSPRSLLHLGFEQLVIDQPELDVRRDAQGKIRVAGFSVPDQTAGNDEANPAADWIFSQRELAIRSGKVRWTDELRGTAPLELGQVDIVIRNPGRQHKIRIDATPPAGWGDRFAVIADVNSPLLAAKKGQWRDWEGQLYADFSRVDVSQLRRYAHLPIEVARGTGALRAWASVGQGSIKQATADLSLVNVQVTLGRDVQPLVLPYINGRLAAESVAGGLRVSTQGLAFNTQEGVVWPGGNLSYLQTSQSDPAKAIGEFKADKLDMAALSHIMDRLPVGTVTHQLVRSFAPKGLVEVVQASWKGHVSAPTSYEAQGRIKNLHIAADLSGPSASESRALQTKSAPPTASRPGIQGATVDFKLNQQGGQAAVVVTQGKVVLPGIFEDPTVPLDNMKVDAKWTVQGDRVDAQLENISFSNADGQGTAKARWHTSDPNKSRSQSRFPGVLDLQGTLSRATGTRIHRYLPLGVPAFARDYVRESVLQANVSGAQFIVKGDVFDMPFADPKLGEFKITAKINNANFAYVPASIQGTNSLTWPSLTQIDAELVFDRTSMSVLGATGRLGSNTLQISRADARIPNLGSGAITVLVSAEGKGTLQDIVGLVNTSPLYNMTSQSLAKASVTGNADIKVNLNLPLNNLEKSKVTGSVTLAGNDVQITPDTPKLSNGKGLISFSETGFAVKDLQARMLGGDVRLEGGSQAGAGPSDVGLVFRAQGSASAESLRQYKELTFVSSLGQYLSGSAAYTATLAFRGGFPELNIQSDLVGMGVSLPAPLAKKAENSMPMRYDNSLVRDSMSAGKKLQDQVLVDLGPVANIAYVRDISGSEPRVLRGGIGVGLAQGETAMPSEDVVMANINFSQVNIDAWQKLLTPAGGPASADSGAANSPSASFNGYLPSVIAVRAKELTLAGRTINNVVVGGSREGLTWRANLDAKELNGYVEYRQPSGASLGRVYARLARLNLAQSTATDLEAALDNQPSAIPALDIVVEDFELFGKKLGRVDIEAINRGAGALARDTAVREWRLNKLNVTLPEAQFTATGNWVAVGALSGNNRPGQRRRTVMNFKLDIADSGELLKRFGMDKVIAKGKGKMEGQVAWLGSPLAFDFPSMAGSFNVNIESGQFLQADPGIAKLIGVLSLQSLPRRLTLDFRDVFSEGFSFDYVRGDIKIDQGVATTNNLQMKGVNAAVLMEGSSDLAKGTQDIKALIVPEINAGTVSLVAAIINPAIGLGTFLAQLILRRPLVAATTQELHIVGTWAAPQVTKVNNKARAETPAMNPPNAP